MEPILHLSLPVGDLDAARVFYVDTLGCRVGRVREGWIILSNGRRREPLVLVLPDEYRSADIRTADLAHPMMALLASLAAIS